MMTSKTTNCAYCSIAFTRAGSANKHCSIFCRFLDIAAEFNGVESCWEWPLSLNPVSGYGQLMTRIGGKSVNKSAHRVSYEFLVCGIPKGMMVCHMCDNRKCFNPKHLFVGTAKDNALDAVSKGRLPDRRVFAHRGEKHWAKRMPSRIPVGTKTGAAKLTEQAVIEIRSSTNTLSYFAKKYGVTEASVCAARNGKTWKHVNLIFQPSSLPSD